MKTLTNDQTTRLLPKLNQYDLFVFELQSQIKFIADGQKVYGFINDKLINDTFGLPIDLCQQIKDSALSDYGHLTIKFDKVLEFKIQQRTWKCKRLTFSITYKVQANTNEIMNLIN